MDSMKCVRVGLIGFGSRDASSLQTSSKQWERTRVSRHCAAGNSEATLLSRQIVHRRSRGSSGGHQHPVNRGGYARLQPSAHLPGSACWPTAIGH